MEKKWCQCAKPRRKKPVLRWTKEDERLPERQVQRTEGKSAFQRGEGSRLNQSCSATWNYEVKYI